MELLKKEDLNSFLVARKEVLFPFFLRRFGNKETAEDLCQETFVAFHKFFTTNPNITLNRAISYLWGVASNKCKKLYHEKSERILSFYPDDRLDDIAGSTEIDIDAIQLDNQRNLLFESTCNNYDLTLTDAEKACFISLNSGGDISDIRKEFNWSYPTADEVVRSIGTKIVLQNFVDDALNGLINNETLDNVICTITGMNKSPFRYLVNKISAATAQDPLRKSLKQKAGYIVHKGITVMESALEKGRAFNGSKFFKGYNLQLLGVLSYQDIVRPLIEDFAGDFVIKNDKAPWAFIHDAMRMANLIGNEDLQMHYKNKLKNWIDDDKSLEAIQHAGYALSYFGDLSPKYSEHFFASSLLEIDTAFLQTFPYRSIVETFINLSDHWYQSKLLLLDINFLRMLLILIKTDSIRYLVNSRDKKALQMIYQISKNIWKRTRDYQVKQLARWLYQPIERKIQKSQLHLD